jgi:alpha-mannosidase
MQKTKFIFTLLLLSLFSNSYSKGQSMSTMNIVHTMAEHLDHYTNGFAQKCSGKDITYNNLWDNVDQAFLTRTTTGDMEISWKTAPTQIASDGFAYYLNIIALDQANPSLPFQVYLNDKPIGYFMNDHSAQYTVQLKHNITFSFHRYAQNEVKDAGCFLVIKVPKSQVEEGKPAKWRVVGKAANANNWFMVFKHQKLKQRVMERAHHDLYFTFQVHQKQLTLQAPFYYQKKKLQLEINHKKVKYNLQANDHRTIIHYKHTAPIQSIRLFDAQRNYLHIASIKDYHTKTLLKGNLLYQQQRENNHFSYRETYSNATEQMLENSERWWSHSLTHIMVSSHQDVAWMDTPYRCEEMRDKHIVTPALKLLAQYPDYCYNLEQSLIVQEYIKRNPEKLDEIKKYVAQGRLSIGASYTQPYEEMQQPEALVRQFYHGKRYLNKLFPGYNALTYWNVDVPGRTLQMPQILAKCGIKGLQYSRHERGIYRWYSPDGSHVLTFTPGHYGVAAQFLRKIPELGIDKYSEYMNSLEDYRTNSQEKPIIGLLSAEDMSEAHAYYEWKDMFDQFHLKTKKAAPVLKHSTSDDFFNALENAKANYPKLIGERPEIWMYIHGPSHERAITTYRNAYRQLITAETFSTIAYLLSKQFHYPKRNIKQAWEDLIYADHGWGGNRGHVTDSLFYARYRHADTLATEINRNSLKYIANHIQFDSTKGTPLIVFNTLSQIQDSPITFNLGQQKEGRIIVYNHKGQKTPHQISIDEKGNTLLHFVAKSVPSIGYSTYFIASKRSKKQKYNINEEANESRFYRLIFDKKGQLEQIYDKELKEGLFDTNRSFKAGDVFSLTSVGNGAGEFDDIQQPTTKNMQQTKSSWILKENGPVYSLYESESQFKEAKIIRQIKLYKHLKRIDFPCHVLNFDGTPYREYRMAFPIKGKAAISYDVPFGTVKVGQDEIKGMAGERYKADNPSIHPRSITNWIGATTSKIAVRLSSSVVVADYIDPCDETKALLQPVLFVSRKSCHWLGEQYSQTGDHHFVFSLRSDAPQALQGAQEAIAANYTPFVVYAPETFQKASLPQQLSFFNIDGNHLSISAIKKHEDRSSIIVRLYNTQRETSHLQLNSFFNIKDIYHTDMLEYRKNKVLQGTPIRIGKASIETFELMLK